jgi:hypothetical protein
VTTVERAAPCTDLLTCVEIGASGVETILLDAGQVSQRGPGATAPQGRPLLIAVPGLVGDNRVIAASNLDWYDVDPAEALGLQGPAVVVCNDAEAAALGESALRPGVPDLVFVGLGTGVGGAVVRDGTATANLFAHGGAFSDRACGCGRTGCLETVAGGWALPATLSDGDLKVIAHAIAEAVRAEPLATPPLVVLAGGVTAAHPRLVELVARAMPDREVVGTAAPSTKSAAAWGLRHLYARQSASHALSQ